MPVAEYRQTRQRRRILTYFSVRKITRDDDQTGAQIYTVRLAGMRGPAAILNCTCVGSARPLSEPIHGHVMWSPQFHAELLKQTARQRGAHPVFDQEHICCFPRETEQLEHAALSSLRRPLRCPCYISRMHTRYDLFLAQVGESHSVKQYAGGISHLQDWREKAFIRRQPEQSDTASAQ